MNGEFGRLTSERADLWHQSQERGSPSLPCSYLTPPGIIWGSNTGGDSVCHIWSNPARALGHPVLDSRALLHQAESSCRNVVVSQMDQVACLAIQENRHMTKKTPKNNPENKYSWRNGSSSIGAKRTQPLWHRYPSSAQIQPGSAVPEETTAVLSQEHFYGDLTQDTRFTFQLFHACHTVARHN